MKQHSFHYNPDVERELQIMITKIAIYLRQHYIIPNLSQICFKEVLELVEGDKALLTSVVEVTVGSTRDDE